MVDRHLERTYKATMVQLRGKRTATGQTPGLRASSAQGQQSRPTPPGPPEAPWAVGPRRGTGGPRRASLEHVAGRSRVVSGRGRPGGAPDEAVYGGQSPSCARMARRGNCFFALCSIRLDCPSRAFCWIMQDSPLGATGWVHRLAQSICAGPSRWTRGRRVRTSRRSTAGDGGGEISGQVGARIFLLAAPRPRGPTRVAGPYVFTVPI